MIGVIRLTNTCDMSRVTCLMTSRQTKQKFTTQEKFIEYLEYKTVVLQASDNINASIQKMEIN